MPRLFVLVSVLSLLGLALVAFGQALTGIALLLAATVMFWITLFVCLAT